jgi:hypothetical protein
VATALCSVAEVVVMRSSGVALLSTEAFRNAFPIVNVATIVGATVGAVILSRHPGHRIGWLFCWGQLGVALGLLLRAVADAGLGPAPPIGPRTGQLADLLANLLGSQLALALLALLFLWSPDGLLPSRRWRPCLVALPVAYAALVLGLLMVFRSGVTLESEILLTVGQLGVLAVLLASVVALALRLHRSTGETRQQLRWIVAAAALLAAAPVVALAYNLGGVPVATVWVVALLHVGYLAVPVATGIAVLRYRLYDIDRLVGGSVVLAVLGALALGGYVAVVALLGEALPGTRSNPWLSLLVFVGVVLILQPLRGAVRRVADRLVYGPQAMSYEALARFTRELSATSTPVAFLPSVAEAAGRLVHAREATARLVDADAGSQQSATWINPGASPGGEAPAATSTVTVPVLHQGVPVGQLELVLPELAVGGARRRELLASLAERVAGGFVHARLELSLRRQAQELTRLNTALEDSRRRLLAAQDLGRRRVADRIRDEVVSRLLPVRAGLAEVARTARVDAAAAGPMVDEAISSTTQAIDRLRLITSTVFSRRLADDGLAAALRAAAPGLGVELTVLGSARWSHAVESWLFACCLELLPAARGPVRLELVAPEGEEVAELVVTAVFPPGPRWLSSTRERLEVLGGGVDTATDRLTLRLPLIAEAVPV